MGSTTRNNKLIVLPLTFLSGTFYSISRLPDFWQTISSFNLFYNLMVLDMRLGVSDSSLLKGVIFLLFINIILI